MSYRILYLLFWRPNANAITCIGPTYRLLTILSLKEKIAFVNARLCELVSLVFVNMLNG